MSNIRKDARGSFVDNRQVLSDEQIQEVEFKNCIDVAQVALLKAQIDALDSNITNVRAGIAKAKLDQKAFDVWEKEERLKAKIEAKKAERKAKKKATS